MQPRGLLISTALRLTARTTTLDYYIYIYRFSLHAAREYSQARSRSTPLVNVPTMPDGVHDNGVLRFEDFEDDAV